MCFKAFANASSSSRVGISSDPSANYTPQLVAVGFHPSYKSWMDRFHTRPDIGKITDEIIIEIKNFRRNRVGHESARENRILSPMRSFHSDVARGWPYRLPTTTTNGARAKFKTSWLQRRGRDAYDLLRKLISFSSEPYPDTLRKFDSKRELYIIGVYCEGERVVVKLFEWLMMQGLNASTTELL